MKSGIPTPILLGRGSAAVPAYSFANGPTYGLILGTSNNQIFPIVNGQLHFSFDASWSLYSLTLGNVDALAWNSGGLGVGSASTPDVILVRDGAAGILALKNGTSAQTLRIYGNASTPLYLSISHDGSTTAVLNSFGSNQGLSLQLNSVAALTLSSLNMAMGLGHAFGQVFSVVSQTELLTIAAAATTDTTLSVPAFAILLSAQVRTTVTIPTAATYTVTTTVGGTALNTAAVSATAPSTDPGTAAGASYRSAATQIRITPNATPGSNAGRVRVTVYYLVSTPATS